MVSFLATAANACVHGDSNMRWQRSRVFGLDSTKTRGMPKTESRVSCVSLFQVYVHTDSSNSCVAMLGNSTSTRQLLMAATREQTPHQGRVEHQVRLQKPSEGCGKTTLPRIWCEVALEASNFLKSGGDRPQAVDNVRKNNSDC